MNQPSEVREMRNAATVLAIIRQRGRNHDGLEDVYRQLYNPDLICKPTNGSMEIMVNER